MSAKSQISPWQGYRLSKRFFIALVLVAFLFAVSFGLPLLQPIAQLAGILLLVGTVVESILLYSSQHTLEATRTVQSMLGLSDENSVTLLVRNRGKLKVHIDLYDEIPYAFQKRDFHETFTLEPNTEKELVYFLRPVERGQYHFGLLNSITSTWLRWVERRECLAQPQTVSVYPSVLQMKKYELMAFARISTFEGIKKIRRIGHSYEFEQIKSYTQGDDIRSINWKATGRKNQLMVNQYEDEKAQQIYTIIDKSRSMHMPFNGLSLLDYSINTSLVISNIALKKSDKAGLITFSHRMGTMLKADRSPLQLKKILHALYQEKPQAFEANYELLYHGIKQVVKSRSLLFLYLNFESSYAMERALPVLRKINIQHLLMVMIFENTELMEYAKKDAEYVSDIYAQTIAHKLITEKKQMVSKLRKNGIQVVLSKPEDISINTLNKYLALKAKGSI
jgi:uncharacterized protein (DUF58 family)